MRQNLKRLEQMQSKFILGDEWIYYKLYCGKKTADIFLLEVIKPVTEELLKQNLIDKWFFIRYEDPNNHLRIRFHCKDISKLGMVIKTFKNAIKYYVNNDFIWKVQVDTYQREIERYGKNSMIESENLFFYDSLASIEALSLIEDDEILFLFVLKSIASLLTVFDYELKNKIIFFKKNLEYFKKEFNADKYLNRQLNKKYQKMRPEVESFMVMQGAKNNYLLDEIIEIRNKNIEQIKHHILELNSNDNLCVSLDNLLSSYIHMIINKFFRDKQRLFELVCYDFLFKYYNSILAKNLKQKN